jgi:hypothetical protein
MPGELPKSNPPSFRPPFRLIWSSYDPTPRRKRRPSVFRERDVTRAIASTMKAGLSVAATEIARDGSIRIVTGAPERTEIASASANEWDEVL